MAPASRPGSRRSRTRGLRIADGLSLPLESVTETFAILGRRGSGKTSTAVVLAEEAIEAGIPVVIVDPTGAWWGLRSSADGKDAGLPVRIFGGDHADFPLEEAAGALIADVLVERRFPAIIDLSTLSKSAMRRFMADFAERLYRSNREPLHLIVDEADVLVPQRLNNDGLRVFGAIDDIVRRGRIRGIGVTLISQRPAVINKDVLSQVEVLVALQLTSKIDVGAIDDWVRLNATDDEAKVVKASLASLPTGTAWVWSPALLNILKKVQVRRRATFDSSATPKPGAPRPAATAFAEVDTSDLGEQIAALAERAKDSDPKRLRTKVADLERKLAAAEKRTESAARTVAKTVAVPAPEIVEVPVLTDEQLAVLIRTGDELREYAGNSCTRIEHAVSHIRDQIKELDGILESVKQAGTSAPAPRPARASEQPRARTPRTAPARASTASSTAPAATTGHGPGEKLGKAHRLILSALAAHGTLRISQIATITGYRHTSGGFKNTLSQLRTSGWIDGSGTGTATITDDGLTALGDYTPLPSGDALLEWWLARGKPLGLAERSILEVLRAHHPEHVDTETIAAETGYSPTSGGFKNAMSKLRGLELASGKGGLVLSDDLVD